MTTTKYENILHELEQFHTELKSYESLLHHLISGKTILGHKLEERDKLREILVRRSGALKRVIIELTAKQYAGNTMSGRIDIWSEAFNTTAFSKNKVALFFCINAVNEAIGRLESDIQRGIRDEQGDLI
jgi:hypothetical protein